MTVILLSPKGRDDAVPPTLPFLLTDSQRVSIP